MRYTTRIVSVLLTMLVAGAALAGDRQETYKLKFDGADGPVDVSLESSTMGFALSELEVGDSRAAVTEDGDQITVTRLENEYAFDIGGERFEIPAMHGAGHHGSPGMHRTLADDALVIVSGQPLDETCQATIRAALSAAGITDAVEFHAPGDHGDRPHVVIHKEIDHDDHDGDERVIVKKRVMRTQ